MKLTWLLLLFLIITAVFAKDRSKKKDRSRNKRINRDKEVEMDEDEEYETVDVVQEGGQDEQEERHPHPCSHHKCKRGENCVLEETSAKCVCHACDNPSEEDQIPKVCSTKNVTYLTECHLDRDHCLCKNRQPGCSDNKQQKVRLDYFGACKELTECPANEFKDFPFRMRDWLLKVMNDMAMRGYEEIDEYRDMLENARTDETHADAVIWKFCDLDVHPHDRHITRRELMFIIASVKPMEHCLVPFLNSCDTNNDNNISLIEWGTCLQIGHEAIIDKCKNVAVKG